MFESCVLGVDPGMASTGLAGVARGGSRITVVWSDTVATAPDLPEPQRLLAVSEAVRSAIASLRPGSVAVERVMFGQNKSSALAVARATGVVLLAAAEAGLDVEEYVPLEVKMAITGIGNADKRQVRDALVRIHRVEGVPQQADAADAVAVAICHLQQSRLRSASRRVEVR